jgi:hypothetical protein
MEAEFSEMANFNEREKGFEEQFRHDQELQFKVTARRNRLLGLWAAEKLGLTGAEADKYAKSVVEADFQKPGDEDVLDKLDGDFTAKGVACSRTQIRHEMDLLLRQAKKQVMEGR